MNNKKQRIAIAEACGWTKIGHYEQEITGRKPTNGFYEIIPDYLNDLNAMHEAEKMLTEHQWDEYERVLRLVCDGCSYFEGAGKELLHATAAQRAEAFLRTIGEWENDK